MILVDGACDSKTTNMGLRWCIQNSHNYNAHDIQGGGSYGSAISALHVEALAYLHALY